MAEEEAKVEAAEGATAFGSSEFEALLTKEFRPKSDQAKTAVENDQDRAAVHEALKFAVLVLSPIAPHVTQSLWETLGEQALLVETGWPAVDEAALVQEHVELVVQVNGKLRGHIELAADADQETAQAAALDNLLDSLGQPVDEALQIDVDLERVVARIAVYQFARMEIENPQEDGDEHGGVVADSGFAVHMAQDAGRGEVVGGARLDQGLGDCHE